MFSKNLFLSISFLLLVNFVFSQSNKSEKTVSIVWYGESTTRGTGVSIDRPWDAFMWRVSDYLKKGVCIKANNKNLGFPGWSTNNAVANIEILLKENFDYVFLEFALNDTKVSPEKVRENLMVIIEKIKIKNQYAKIILVLLNNYEGLISRMNNKTEFTSKTWITVSKEMNVSLIDVGSQLIKLSTDELFFKSIIPDGIHPNAMGHFIYSNIIINELIRKNIFSRKSCFK